MTRLFATKSRSQRPVLCILLWWMLAGPLNSSGQNIPGSISGTVRDETGAPMQGVSISLQNSQNGTQTNKAGEFAINAAPGMVLVFSYTNYEPVQLRIGGKTFYTVNLQPRNSHLNEVVIIGYGTQKKVNLTGSVSTIDKKQIENRPVANAVDALQGTAPGLVVTRTNGQPGKEGWNLNIRGFSSLNGTNSPLVLIDGIEGDLTKINPADIENVSVLKDAAAAAIYGAKAAGGVMLITTKKGFSGRINVGYTGLYTLKRPYSMPERIHSWEEAQMVNISNENAGLADAYTQRQIGWMQSKDSNFVMNDPYKLYYYYDLNQIPLLLRKTSPSQSHEVYAQGGNEKTQYLFSLGYYSADGIFKFGPDANQRYNARVNVSTKLSNLFSLDSRVSYAENLIQSPVGAANGDGGLFYQIYQLRTRFPIFLPGDSSKYASTGSGATLYDNLKNGGYANSTDHLLNGVFTLKGENLVKGLGLRLVYSPQLEQTNSITYAQNIPLWSYSQGVPVIATSLNNPNSVSKSRLTQTNNNVQALADYDLNLHDVHHFHVLGGFQYQYYNYDLVTARNTNLVTNSLPSLDYTSSPNMPPTNVSDNIQANTWVSSFGRLDYNYKEKYFIEGTIRQDASSRLAPGHRSQVFPAVSAAWRISKEEWFSKTLPFVNELKLRGSWGKLGNAQLGPNYGNNYDFLALLNSGSAYPFNNTSNPSLYQAALPSPGLGWETITTSDGGIDLSLFNSRLTAGFDYFSRVNDNVMISIPKPALLGVNPSTQNGASIKTWGWEGSIGWKDRAGKVNYWVNANISDNHNKVTRYEGVVAYSEGVNTALPGLPINSIFGYKAIGYYQTKDEVAKSPIQFGFNNQGPGDLKYQDVNHDGVINQGKGTQADHGDLVYLGNTSPRYLFGINLGAQWKGFDLSALFQGVGKRNIVINTYAALPFVNSYRMAWKVNENYWTVNNPNALFPRLYAGGGTNAVMSSKWVQNAAYLRVKNIQIGYTLPAYLVKKAGMQSVRVFFSGQDIWEKNKMWFKYYDAENPDNASFNYPFFRSYACGLNVIF